MKKTVHAIWKDGQTVPTQPVEWPEGTALAIEPIEGSHVLDREGDLLGDDPASIARWLAWFDSLEPLNFTPEEEAAWQAARRERRDWEKSRFNENQALARPADPAGAGALRPSSGPMGRPDLGEDGQ